MEKNTSLIIITVILVLVAGGLGWYFVGMKQAPKTMEGYQTVTPNPTAEEVITSVPAVETPERAKDNTIVVPMKAQNGSDQSGTAVLSDDNGKVKVVLNVSGGTIDNPVPSSLPAHIHIGSCPNPGAVLYPLTNIVGGKSETVIDTTLADLKTKGALAINVHQSKEEMAVYTACGDIK